MTDEFETTSRGKPVLTFWEKYELSMLLADPDVVRIAGIGFFVAGVACFIARFYGGISNMDQPGVVMTLFGLALYYFGGVWRKLEINKFCSNF